MALDITVMVIRPGSTTIDLSLDLKSGSWSTVAVGGFADASLTVKGWRTRTQIPYLSIVRVHYDTTLLYEGRVEDLEWSLADGEITTTLTCFGLQRLLADVSVRRVWSKRAIDWQDYTGASIGSILDGGLMTKADLEVSVGNYDLTDLTKSGVQVKGKGTTVPTNGGGGASFTSPIALTRLMADFIISGPNTGSTKIGALQWWSVDGTGTWTNNGSGFASGSIDTALTTGTTRIALGVFNGGAALTPTASDFVQYSNIRLLGTSLTEDASGGFYGGSILRDLIALVPGLTIGLIQDGSDYTIQQLERAVRDTAQSVVDEVAGYYTRKWAVWESLVPGTGRFDWKTVNLDEPHWIVTLDALAKLSLRGSLDGITRTSYVLYTDAASGLDSEASATSADRRNPFVGVGQTKDDITQASFPMTSNTASQLATLESNDKGMYPLVSGRIKIPLTTLVSHGPTGSAKPAFAIRAGETILIADLPKSEPFRAGRDGETLFQIVSSQVEVGGQVTLELESYLPAADVIVARLADVTRSLTG